MDKTLFWDIFSDTGAVDAYLLYREIEQEEEQISELLGLSGADRQVEIT